MSKGVGRDLVNWPCSSWPNSIRLKRKSGVYKTNYNSCGLLSLTTHRKKRKGKNTPEGITTSFMTATNVEKMRVAFNNGAETFYFSFLFTK